MRKPRPAPLVFVSLLGALLLTVLPSQVRSQAPAPPPPSLPPDAAQPAVPPGAPDQVTLELQRNQRLKIRLAIPKYRAAGFGSPGSAAAAEVEGTVRRDLDYSGYFEIQGPEQLAGLTLAGDISTDRDVYRSAGNDVLLAGDLREEEGKIVFEGRLYDLKSGQSILAKRYRGSFTTARRIGHTFADEVIRYLTGGAGFALSEIAYVSERGKSKEIWLMDYDGGNPRQVTGHRSTSMSPAWDPAGDGVAYTSFVNGPPGIFFAEIASGKKRPMVTSGSLNISPSFSPDGQRIVFARSVSGNIEIFTSDRSGGNLRRLTQSAAIDASPAWSPKGGVIAFTSSRAGNPQVYVMDEEGSNPRRLSFDGTYSDGAAWSPDGGEVAYASRRDGRFQIAVTNVVTLQTRVLTGGPGENESPVFSPDGRKIAFTSRRSGTKQIYVLDAADGANVRQVTTVGSNDMADWSRPR
ncbi:MAG TPA: Tol-Pal system beta propeller repeat protein TolB [Thermoanaerobaculia bacterium]|nr:Tol-Pal system beta propeller repeat protein TolB [Thermoanaerobaculia bacterium]